MLLRNNEAMLKPLFHLTWMRMTEQPAQMLHLAVTLAVVVLAWMVLSALAVPFLVSSVGQALDARLHVENARGNDRPFPLRYMQRIGQMPGVERVRWSTLGAFFCADGSRRPVSINAYGGEIGGMFRGEISNDDLAVWQTTENGLLVGAELARRCGFTPGMALSPDNPFGRGEIPLKIIAILHDRDGLPSQLAYGHYNYVNRFVPTQLHDQVTIGTVYGTDTARLDRLALAIEREFQAADPSLQVITSGSAAPLLGRFGQVQGLIWLVMSAMALCALLIFPAVVAHQTGKRRTSMAILQTMGFTGRVQLLGLSLEVIGIVFAGTLLGLAGGSVLLALLSPWLSAVLMIGALQPPDWAMHGLWPALLVLLAVTLAWPAWQLSRLKPIDHLRL